MNTCTYHCKKNSNANFTEPLLTNANLIEPLLTVQNLSYQYEFDLHENKPVVRTDDRTHLHYEWFHTKTLFDTDAQDNSGVAH